MDDWRDGSVGWRRPLAAVVIVTVLCLGGITLLGTQVSRILSTVGASVGPNAGNSDPGSNVGNAGNGAGDEEPAPNGGGGGNGGGGVGSAVPAGMLDAARPDLLIIKTGQVTIRAASIGPAVETVTAKVVALGGYVSGSTRSGTGDNASASVTFRVPARQWEAALAVARGAGEDVLDEQTETSDVTGDVVDLEARIRNLQATEAALQGVMAKAAAIEDILAVQSRLTEVQGEIEQLSSRASDLQQRAALSTLTVNVRTRPAPVIAKPEAAFDPGHEADAASARLVKILERVATVGIWAAIVWLPILAALAIVAGVGFLVARRFRRLFGGGAGGAGGPDPLPEGGA